ncbi:MAG: hypothetical protein LBU74_02170 [Methanobacteriaceae archaeon]|jgi:hypothetical protein|nr:hypothetical protein [Candidatus Methanorudis spinitermitis]
MKYIKIILIICVIVIGAADIIIYNYGIDLFSQIDGEDVPDNQKFVESLKNASKYEEIWQESMDKGVIIKIVSKLRSPSSLNKSMPEIKSSLAKSKDANENTLKYLNNSKKFATNDIEKQYIDLLIQKANINKKIYDSYAKMIIEYEKFANKKLSAAELSKKMTDAKQDLIENNAIDVDKTAINTKILILLKKNPDLQKKLEGMNINPAFLGQN